MKDTAQKIMEAFYQPVNRSPHYYDKYSVAAALRETINILQDGSGMLKLSEEIEKL